MNEIEKLNKEAYNYLVGINPNISDLLIAATEIFMDGDIETTEIAETNVYLYVEIKNNYIKDITFEITMDGDDMQPIGTDILRNNLEQLIKENERNASDDKENENHTYLNSF